MQVAFRMLALVGVALLGAAGAEGQVVTLALGDAAEVRAHNVTVKAVRYEDVAVLEVRRSHPTQYFSYPGYDFDRLRREAPAQYEAYADMVAGDWTTMRIEVAGTKARLFVNGASQPCLIVNDLKHGDRPGRIALWAHVETDAYFGPISVSAR